MNYKPLLLHYLSFNKTSQHPWQDFQLHLLNLQVDYSQNHRTVCVAES